MKYLDFLDKELEAFPDTPSLYRFKREITAEMTQRANEITAAGIKDDKVLNDLVISEFENVAERYAKEQKTAASLKKAKKYAKLSFLFSSLYFIAVTCIFLLYSLVSRNWGKSWLIMVAGAFGFVIIMLGFLSASAIEKKGSYKPARFSFAVSIILIAVFIFLTLITAHISGAYIIFIAAPAIILIGDALFAVFTKSRTAIFSILLYLPVIAALLYVCLGISGIIAWKTGWVLIIAALLADIAIGIKRTLKVSD